MLCFRKSPAAKKFMDKRGLQDFLSETFCLTVPKITVGESFRLSLISGIEKIWTRVGGGSIKIFRRKFLSQSAEKFRMGNLLCCVSENFL